jgi:hypothetical protein
MLKMRFLVLDILEAFGKLKDIWNSHPMVGGSVRTQTENVPPVWSFFILVGCEGGSQEIGLW